MVTNIKDFEVMGSSRRCLILNIEGRPTYCSTSNYAYLCQHANARWDIVVREGHEDLNTGRYYPETHWLQVYKPTLF